MHHWSPTRLLFTPAVGLLLTASLNASAGDAPLTTNAPVQAQSTVAFASPLEDFAAAVLQPGNALMAGFVQRPDMARELLRIASDDATASEYQAANTAVFAAIGETYVAGQRFLGGLPELPGIVFTQGLNMQPIVGYMEWPLEEAWVGLPEYGNMASVAIYTARFGTGPEHIGIKMSVNHALAANLACVGQLGCNTISYTPFDLIDPTSQIGAQDAGEFLQAAARGDFDDDAALHAWFAARVVAPSVYTGNSASDSDGAARACNEAALRECLNLVQAQHDAAGAACAATHGPKIEAAEKAVRDAARGFITSVAAGTAGGAIGGAISGTAGGPLTPLTSALGALLGGTLGAAIGAITWAISEDVDSLTADLEQAKANARQCACDVFRATASRMKDCWRNWCPDELENASIVADAWVASNGC